jgi:hypothetical protein
MPVGKAGDKLTSFRAVTTGRSNQLLLVPELPLRGTTETVRKVHNEGG